MTELWGARYLSAPVVGCPIPLCASSYAIRWPWSIHCGPRTEQLRERNEELERQVIALADKVATLECEASQDYIELVQAAVV